MIELAGSASHGSSQEDFVMDTIELRAAATRLLNLHQRFAPCFGRRECQEHSLGYLRGLLLAGVMGQRSLTTEEAETRIPHNEGSLESK